MTGRRAVSALAVAAALLLVAGVAGLAARDRDGGVAPEGRVGAAGLDQSALLDHDAVARSVETTLAVTAPPLTAPTATVTTTTMAPARTTTTTTRVSTAPTLRPGAPPASPPPTGIPNIAPANSWSAERDGVRLSVRIDPAAPVAGQPVKFLLDASSAESCCTVMVDFGDGSGGYSANNGVPCGSLTPGAKSFATTHTYAAAGAYKVTVSAMTGMTCPPPLAPGQAPLPPDFRSAALTACVAIGPGAAGQGGCSPFPAYGPDDIVSPVIDPFCQIRSDCTQASPPRQ